MSTSAWSIERLARLVFTQRMLDSPDPPGVFVDFWTGTYQALDD